MYKIIRIGQPPYLHEFFVKNVNRTSTRGLVRDLVVPESRTDVEYYSFSAQRAWLWNAIPSKIKFLPSFSKYKRAIYETFS